MAATKEVDAEDEDYQSAEDEDFNPDTVVDDGNVSSSDDEGKDQSGKQTKSKKRKLQDEDLESGDEATIRESKRSRKKNASDDEGGDGGEIKTRAQRRADKQVRAEFQKTHGKGVTVDVDALWTQLSSKAVGRRVLSEIEPAIVAEPEASANNTNTSSTAGQPKVDNEADMVTVTQVHEFAGELVSKEVRVHKDSKEAQAFISRQSKPIDPVTSKTLRRPLARQSMFEPNPTREVKGLPADRQRLRAPSRADVLAAQMRDNDDAKEKAHRMNTVQKSALDWAKHVDAQGLKDELSEYGRSKQGYMAKKDFLDGVTGRKELEERNARLQAA